MLSRRALGLAVALAAGCAPPPPPVTPAPVRPPYELPVDPAREAGSPLAPPAPAVPSAPPSQEVRPPDPPLQDVTVYRVPLGSSPTRGDAAALVTIVEFADFECPFCARAEGSIRRIEAKYGGLVRFVWKNMPLPFHDHAEPAAELALEARAQRGDAGFWKAHDMLLAQGRLEDADLADIAARAGLDADRALGRVRQHAHLASIEADVTAGEDVDAGATPTFFINGRKLVGAQPFSAFEPIIEEQLAAARATVASGVPAARVYEALQREAKLAPLDLAPVAPPTDASPSRGPRSAKVVVQIWSDLECPYCKRVEPTLSALEAAFPGQIRIVRHNHPLPLHAHAEKAAEAAMEAFAQKGTAAFWKMHDLILANQEGRGQERAALDAYATAVGLDVARFDAALDGGVHRTAIRTDSAAGLAAGLTATPGFSINGYRVNGAAPLGYFKKVVRRALADAK